MLPGKGLRHDGHMGTPEKAAKCGHGPEEMDYPSGLPSTSCVSNRKCPQITGRASGSMCSTTSPFWKMRTAPDDWLTATAMAVVFRLMAAAAQWREPGPLLRVVPSAVTAKYMQAATAAPSRRLMRG